MSPFWKGFWRGFAMPMEWIMGIQNTHLSLPNKWVDMPSEERYGRLMPNGNETISLHTQNANGTGGEAVLCHFAGKQVGQDGQPLLNPNPLVATSNQPTLVGAFVSGTDVDIRTVGIATNVSQCTVTVSDGRNINGVPVTYTITVNITAAVATDQSAILAPLKDAVRTL